MENNRAFWDRVARFYGPIQEKSNSRLYRRTARCCAPYIGRKDRVLELACGTGQLTRPLCGRAGSWEATDFSEKMIGQLRRSCPEQVTLSVQDATALPYEDGSFQVVLIANALHIMPRPEQALREIFRVLAPGGIVLAPTFVYEGKQDIFSRFRMHMTEKLGFCSYFKWKLQDLTALLEQAGFDLLEQQILPGHPLPEGFAAGKKK